MDSANSRCGIVSVVGSIAALGLLIPTQVAMCSTSGSSDQDQAIGPAGFSSSHNDVAPKAKALAEHSTEAPEYLAHGAYTQPAYPREALQKGVEGYVVVQFDLTEDGNVEDPIVLESEPPEVFDQSAIRSAKKFKFRPKVVDGSPIRVEGVKRKIVFSLQDETITTESGEHGGLDARGEASGDEDGSEYLPLVKVRPDYPSRALERGIEGSVTVKFTVTQTGSVEDPVVVESDPPGIFDRAAIRAASRYKYRPTVVDGSPIRVEDVTHKIVFELEDAADEESGVVIQDSGQYLPLVKVAPKYPARALARGIEGSVTLKFTVTETGSVEDPVVVESDPPGIFDRAATDAASMYKYRPKIVDGKPVRVEGVKNKIVFELEDAADEESGVVIQDSGQYLPLVKVAPKYPARALARGIEGSVTLKFTVTETGSVEDPVVVESDPPGIFDRAATDAASMYKYRPKIVDGKPVRVEGVKNKIVFAIEN